MRQSEMKERVVTCAGVMRNRIMLNRRQLSDLMTHPRRPTLDVSTHIIQPVRVSVGFRVMFYKGRTKENRTNVGKYGFFN